MARRDDFFGAAGLDTSGEWSFLFNDTGDVFIHSPSTVEDSIEQSEFSRAFESWLSDSHPQDASRFYFASLNPLAGWVLVPDADTMPMALRFVGEFVAQSDQFRAPPADLSNTQGP